VADLPLALDGSLADRLAHALDQEAKIPRALEALGPVADRDVALLDGGDGLRAAQLRELGARVRWDDAAGAADVVVGLWSAVRGGQPDDIAAAERLTRPGGRLLLVHDYGRDDVSRLLGEPTEPLAWSRRDGPFLGAGFRIRVVHCFWTFDDLPALRTFVTEAFGSAGTAVADTVQRPRLSYNVAVYHRTVGVDR
jgi:hypothetical protein